MYPEKSQWSSEFAKEKGLLLPQNQQQPPVEALGTDDPEEVRSHVDADDASVASSK